jgi:hypothetical protein
MIPPSALSGSRRKRLVNGTILTVGTAVPALFLLAIGVAPGINRTTPADWLLPLGFGVALGALSYAFGRLTVAAWTEKRRALPITGPGLWPFGVSLLAIVLALASIPLSKS